jgi:hypothetical protein
MGAMVVDPVDGDTRSWGEMAVARLKARAKAKTKTVA